MRIKSIAFTAFVMFFILSAPVLSSDWVDIKNSKDLRALYSNKTFRSTFAGVPIVEHYRADGKGILISGEMRYPRTWVVKGNDQVCVSDERTGTDCWTFQRHKKNRDEYVRKGHMMVIFKVEDGIPEF